MALRERIARLLRVMSKGQGPKAASIALVPSTRARPTGKVLKRRTNFWSGIGATELAPVLVHVSTILFDTLIQREWIGDNKCEKDFGTARGCGYRLLSAPC